MTASSGKFSPASAAFMLSHWLDALAMTGEPRFPVDVISIAKGVGRQLGWDDEIVDVLSDDIPSFEGGLFSIGAGRWAIIYNRTIASEGRIRFTLAHELGHFLLHLGTQDSFECSEEDVLLTGSREQQIEGEADAFASQLLMPLPQFRAMTGTARVDLEVLSRASSLFGVSLTSACLRWIRATSESAVIVLSRDGFIDWAVSSDLARKNGVFFKCRQQTVELPAGSLAADSLIVTCKGGSEVPLRVWFEHAHPDAVAREMKLSCENYGYTLTLLALSPSDKVWPPWEDGRNVAMRLPRRP